MVEWSEFIFSIVCSQPLSFSSTCWPLRIIVIGSPVVPFVEYAVLSGASLAVAPNLIELPNLPSTIVSPSKGNNGWILKFSLKYSPKGTSTELSPSAILTVWPATTL